MPTYFVFGLCLLQPVWANIYTFVADDGAVNLSNMPTDSRYKVLVKGQDEAEPDTGSPPAALARKAQYDRLVDDVAHTYGLDSALLHAVISVESRYSPNAVSKKGAAGLMQLMPVTAKRYGVADALDPVQNLHGGAKCLRDLLKRFNNDVSLALAAYNAGENAVVRNGYRIPPNRETVAYVPKVLDYYRKYQTNVL
ncbi:lytic transglycosylase domain-containing protein [Ferrigenium kumadai]|uniref:lytic transglycosylase domain-containing protein n=1 Tax=Ferrigenium kumadai TaxID=1682490 RepID=UPI001FECFB85|nr:lytic transglycosylase domain-containing protein [Ferrigenium kumadai]